MPCVMLFAGPRLRRIKGPPIEARAADVGRGVGARLLLQQPTRRSTTVFESLIDGSFFVCSHMYPEPVSFTFKLQYFCRVIDGGAVGPGVAVHNARVSSRMHNLRWRTTRLRVDHEKLTAGSNAHAMKMRTGT